MSAPVMRISRREAEGGHCEALVALGRLIGSCGIAVPSYSGLGDAMVRFR